MKDYVLGMDIGYSNLKLTMGIGGEVPHEILIPAGAGPAKKLITEFVADESKPKKESYCYVNINGAEWAGGVSMTHLEGVERELHADYPATDKYKALFYTSLIKTQQSHVDKIVTGLPVDQFKNYELRQRLIRQLIGPEEGHLVNGSKRVTVGDVEVLPQPMGAWMNLLSEIDDLELLEEGRVVVFDPGYFSADWCAMQGRALKKESSGTSTQAMSRILERSAEIINKEGNTNSCSKDQIEDAIRRYREFIFVDGERVKYKGFINKAAAEIAPQALSKMKQSMREDNRNPDIFLIAGGGSHVYEEAGREVFPKSRIIIPENPAMVISKGFYFYGS